MAAVVGIDEVGRGAWAGPLLVVAHMTTKNLPTGLKDSKLLKPVQRLAFAHQIAKQSRLGLGWVYPQEIDEQGLSRAMKLGVERALMQLAVTPDAHIIMDGKVNYCPSQFSSVQAIVKADNQIPEVSAASIIAKVVRDGYMKRLARWYPAYGFEQHVGYGTKLHREQLQKHGVSSLHRRSYQPVLELL